MPTSKIARCSLWFAGLLMAACVGAPPDPQTATSEQAITRIPCGVTADCSSRGGTCRGSVCRADNECVAASDCAAGSPCVADVNFGGLCAANADTDPAALPAVRCSSAGTCPKGQFCDADGNCKPVPKCHKNRDCPKGQICDPATDHCTAPPTPTPPCKDNAGCPKGDICDVTNGKCFPDPHCVRRPDGTCCDPKASTCPAVPCTVDSDCPSDWVCRRNDPSSPVLACGPK